MARKNLLADLLDDKLTAVNAPEQTAPSLPMFNGRGAVGAMSRSLEQLSAEVQAARSISDAISAGETVMEIAPENIDASFVSDRFVSGADIADLTASIEAHGQQVPILVRPHPSTPGRFQAAYGHRRLRALSALGRAAKCIVRQLDDEALVVAQGQENSARRDLSFIERASFGATLDDRGFARDIIMAALSVDKTELSRMLSTRRALPDELVAAIGAAPGIGRRRWMELVDLLKAKKAVTRALEVTRKPEFGGRTSDQRFSEVAGALAARAVTSPSQEWRDRAGLRVAQVRQTASSFSIAIDAKVAPDFGQFLLDELPSLYESYRARRATSTNN